MPFLPSSKFNVVSLLASLSLVIKQLIHPSQPSEDIRAQYRYLDLRRDELAINIRKRSKIARVVRTVLEEHGDVVIVLIADPTAINVDTGCQVSSKLRRRCS